MYVQLLWGNIHLGSQIQTYIFTNDIISYRGEEYLENLRNILAYRSHKWCYYSNMNTPQMYWAIHSAVKKVQPAKVELTRNFCSRNLCHINDKNARAGSSNEWCSYTDVAWHAEQRRSKELSFSRLQKRALCRHEKKVYNGYYIATSKDSRWEKSLGENFILEFYCCSKLRWWRTTSRMSNIYTLVLIQSPVVSLGCLDNRIGYNWTLATAFQMIVTKKVSHQNILQDLLYMSVRKIVKWWIK